MMCTTCGRIAVPDTWIPGSDLAEVAAWCCLGVPGLAYCAWRHVQREKHCADCGGGNLVREARASRRGVENQCAQTHSRGSAAWPRALRTPRRRMRSGIAWAALGLLGVLSGLLPFPAATSQAALGHTAAFFSMSWMFVQIALFHKSPTPWLAWDESGRPVEVTYC
jgi:hypothetical protein